MRGGVDLGGSYGGNSRKPVTALSDPSAGQQHSSTAAQQHSSTAGQQDSRTAGQQDSRTAGQQHSRTNRAEEHGQLVLSPVPRAATEFSLGYAAITFRDLSDFLGPGACVFDSFVFFR